MICFPNAKINLGLNIVRKRTDGYHDIETVFYPIPIHDALEITEAEQTSFRQTGIRIDAPAEKNLVMKALAKLKENHTIPELQVELRKAIPFGAGLGGGSSDAAFMLKLVNEFAHLQLSETELERIASTLGADCAFFVRNKPVFASGIGNVFEPISLSLKGWHLVLVKPDVSVSTAEAYAQVVPHEPTVSLKEIIAQPVETWKETMVNDFETSVFAQFPLIRRIKERLYEAGAVYASMSGSGSSVFGLFADETQLKALFPDCFVWEGRL